MPHSGQEPDNEKVKIDPFFVASQRDINIVPENTS
jgi:hypothetical protein